MTVASRVAAGFVSLTEHSPTGDDRPYLEWHALDHMPEQYRIPGIVLGQRWASTPACRQSRSVSADGWAGVEHAVCYLMGEPVDVVVDEFLALGRRLREAGRFEGSLPSRYRGPLDLVGTSAAARTRVSPEVVPFRPHRGIYLTVDVREGDEPTGPDPTGHPLAYLDAWVSVEGVAGAWTFATAGRPRHSLFTPGGARMTICYLDGDPVATAKRLGPVVEDGPPVPGFRRVLAAPFESLVSWDWDRFGPVPPC